MHSTLVPAAGTDAEHSTLVPAAGTDTEPSQNQNTPCLSTRTRCFGVAIIGFAMVMGAFSTGKTYGLHAAMWSGNGNGIIEKAAWAFSANHIYRDFDQCMALSTDL